MTPSARAVLGLAEEEARVLNHRFLGTEHILLGLMREADSDAARILASRTTLAQVRSSVEEIVGVDSAAPSQEPAYTPRAARVVHLAQREADLYGEGRIAPEHLLVGIVREGEGMAFQVLMRLGVELGALLNEVRPLLGTPYGPSDIPPPDERPEG
jgi:ATP-dependent Clp protease ATP-binding subunit ClpC